MQVALGRETIGRRDPAKELELERIAGLQVVSPASNVLGHANLDRRAPLLFILAYEVNRHRPCPVASVSICDQSFP